MNSDELYVVSPRHYGHHGHMEPKQPQIAASVAEETVQVVFCPTEAPFKTSYRSSSGSVSCGEER